MNGFSNTVLSGQTDITDLETTNFNKNYFFQKLPELPSKRDKILQGADNPYDDITLSEDDNGNITAKVTTFKGLIEAICDPANPDWRLTTNWKSDGSLFTDIRLNGGSRLNPLPVSKIHDIEIMNDLDIQNLDNETAKQFRFSKADLTKNAQNDKGTSLLNYTSYKFISIRHDDLIINGNGHAINMGFNNFALEGINYRSPEVKGQPYKENWTIKNLTIYVSTYWGFVSCNTGAAVNRDLSLSNIGEIDPTDPSRKLTTVDDEQRIKDAKNGLNGGYSWITYDNDNIIGAQVSWTNRGTTGVTILNNVTAKSLFSYRIPESFNSNNHIWYCEGGGTQQNFQVDRIVFGKNSKYTGSTWNGNALELTGKATLEDGSVVNLYPHGNSAENKGILNEGVLINGSSSDSTLILNGSAKLNIICDTDDINSNVSSNDDGRNENDKSNPCGAFEMEGSNAKIIFNSNSDKDSPEVNMDSYGSMYSNSPLVYLQGGVANLAHGKFSVHAHNLNSYTTPGNGGLIKFDNTMQINVQSGGDFNVDVADKNNDSTKPINLIYAVTLNLSIMNPKNVSLDLRNDNCKNSALVYIYNSTPQTIHAYDTRISALGNSEPVSGSNIPGTLGNTNGGKDVSLGMEKPLRVQTLELPFIYSAINANMYLNNTAKIQAPGATLDELKGDMAEMQGKEFRYVHLSDLPGPVISSIPHLSRPSTRKITGNVTGDQWQNINDSASPKGEEFIPKPPLIRVQLQHHNETTGLDEITDLGTVVNDKEAYQKENSDPQDITKVPVSPNKLKSSSLDVDDKNIGQPINNDSDEPKYLNSEKGDITWSDSHNFSYDLDTLLTNYNKNHSNSTLSLKPNDTIKTSAVTNYQETPIQDTRISNLDLEKGDEPTEPFLLDDQVQMPFKYLDTESKAKKLYLSGTIYQLVTDDAGNTTNKAISSFTKKEFDINKPGEWITGYLTLPDATKNSGNYVVEFNGTDDLNNVSSTGKDEDLYWKYQVSPLPKYNGKKVLNDHTTGDTTKPSNIVTNLHYNVTTTFEIANSSNSQNLSNVMFSHYGSDDAGITDDDSDYTLTASYIDDKGQITNKQLKSDFKYNTTYYTPGDFGINQGTFPKGVKFTITRNILVKKKAKDDTDKLVKIGADQMYSKEGDNKVGTLLSTSNSIGYNSIGSIVLNVGNKPIDYGTNPVAVPLKKERVFFIPKTQDPKVSVTNNTPYSQPIILTAQVDGDTSGLNNWLYYRKTEGNADDSDTLMTNKVTVFHDSVGTNVPQNISSSWFNPKTGEQVTGPILKLGQNSSPTPGKYSTKITWNLTNSL